IISCTAALINSGCGGDKNAAVAEIIDCKGDVKVNNAAGAKGNKLKNDDIVEVEKNSYAQIKYLKENYDFMIYCTEKSTRSSKCQIKSSRDSGKTFVFNLISGLLTFFVPPKEQRNATLQITADDAVISIHQTQGKVVNDENKLTVGLAEGEVAVNIDGKDTFVSAGEKLEWNKQKAQKPEVKPYDIYSKEEKSLYFKGGDSQIFMNLK
ncbi:MAG TPA: FecR domain-containing protein, partial [Candidatus Wallbacteria bacterium]|nr:FecR domain-containing protein [Candidatus Wallbacteria bacterium]